MQSFEALVDLFRQSGRKITPQRRAILELLVQLPGHPTAEDIYRHVVTTMPDVSRATVYNTLHELVALGGLIEAFEFGESTMRYDTNTDEHHHLFCVDCHALADTSHDFRDVTLTDEEAAGYQVLHRRVTFFGRCPSCRAREKHG